MYENPFIRELESTTELSSIVDNNDSRPINPLQQQMSTTVSKQSEKASRVEEARKRKELNFNTNSSDIIEGTVTVLPDGDSGIVSVNGEPVDFRMKTPEGQIRYYDTIDERSRIEENNLVNQKKQLENTYGKPFEEITDKEVSNYKAYQQDRVRNIYLQRNEELEKPFDESADYISQYEKNVSIPVKLKISGEQDKHKRQLVQVFSVETGANLSTLTYYDKALNANLNQKQYHKYASDFVMSRLDDISKGLINNRSNYNTFTEAFGEMPSVDFSNQSEKDSYFGEIVDLAQSSAYQFTGSLFSLAEDYDVLGTSDFIKDMNKERSATGLPTWRELANDSSVATAYTGVEQETLLNMSQAMTKAGENIENGDYLSAIGNYITIVPEMLAQSATAMAGTAIGAGLLASGAGAGAGTALIKLGGSAIFGSVVASGVYADTQEYAKNNNGQQMPADRLFDSVLWNTALVGSEAIGLGLVGKLSKIDSLAKIVPDTKLIDNLIPDSTIARAGTSFAVGGLGEGLQETAQTLNNLWQGRAEGDNRSLLEFAIDNRQQLEEAGVAGLTMGGSLGGGAVVGSEVFSTFTSKKTGQQSTPTPKGEVTAEQINSGVVTDNYSNLDNLPIYKAEDVDNGLKNYIIKELEIIDNKVEGEEGYTNDDSSRLDNKISTLKKLRDEVLESRRTEDNSVSVDKAQEVINENIQVLEDRQLQYASNTVDSEVKAKEVADITNALKSDSVSASSPLATNRKGVTFSKIAEKSHAIIRDEISESSGLKGFTFQSIRENTNEYNNIISSLDSSIDDGDGEAKVARDYLSTEAGAMALDLYESQARLKDGNITDEEKSRINSVIRSTKDKANTLFEEISSQLKAYNSDNTSILVGFNGVESVSIPNRTALNSMIKEAKESLSDETGKTQVSKDNIFYQLSELDEIIMIADSQAKPQLLDLLNSLSIDSKQSTQTSPVSTKTAQVATDLIQSEEQITTTATNDVESIVMEDGNSDLTTILEEGVIADIYTSTTAKNKEVKAQSVEYLREYATVDENTGEFKTTETDINLEDVNKIIDSINKDKNSSKLFSKAVKIVSRLFNLKNVNRKANQQNILKTQINDKNVTSEVVERINKNIDSSVENINATKNYIKRLEKEIENIKNNKDTSIQIFNNESQREQFNKQFPFARSLEMKRTIDNSNKNKVKEFETDIEIAKMNLDFLEKEFIISENKIIVELASNYSIASSIEKFPKYKGKINAVNDYLNSTTQTELKSLRRSFQDDLKSRTKLYNMSYGKLLYVSSLIDSNVDIQRLSPVEITNRLNTVIIILSQKSVYPKNSYQQQPINLDQYSTTISPYSILSAMRDKLSKLKDDRYSQLAKDKINADLHKLNGAFEQYLLTKDIIQSYKKNVKADDILRVFNKANNLKSSISEAVVSLLDTYMTPKGQLLRNSVMSSDNGNMSFSMRDVSTDEQYVKTALHNIKNNLLRKSETDSFNNNIIGARNTSSESFALLFRPIRELRNNESIDYTELKDNEFISVSKAGTRTLMEIDPNVAVAVEYTLLEFINQNDSFDSGMELDLLKERLGGKQDATETDYRNVMEQFGMPYSNLSNSIGQLFMSNMGLTYNPNNADSSTDVYKSLTSNIGNLILSLGESRGLFEVSEVNQSNLKANKSLGKVYSYQGTRLVKKSSDKTAFRGIHKNFQEMKSIYEIGKNNSGLPLTVVPKDKERRGIGARNDGLYVPEEINKILNKFEKQAQVLDVSASEFLVEFEEIFRNKYDSKTKDHEFRTKDDLLSLTGTPNEIDGDDFDTIAGSGGAYNQDIQAVKDTLSYVKEIGNTDTEFFLTYKVLSTLRAMVNSKGMNPQTMKQFSRWFLQPKNSVKTLTIKKDKDGFNTFDNFEEYSFAIAQAFDNVGTSEDNIKLTKDFLNMKHEDLMEEFKNATGIFKKFETQGAIVKAILFHKSYNEAVANGDTTFVSRLLFEGDSNQSGFAIRLANYGFASLFDGDVNHAEYASTLNLLQTMLGVKTIPNSIYAKTFNEDGTLKAEAFNDPEVVEYFKDFYMTSNDAKKAGLEDTYTSVAKMTNVPVEASVEKFARVQHELDNRNSKEWTDEHYMVRGVNDSLVKHGLEVNNENRSMFYSLYNKMQNILPTKAEDGKVSPFLREMLKSMVMVIGYNGGRKSTTEALADTVVSNMLSDFTRIALKFKVSEQIDVSDIGKYTGESTVAIESFNVIASEIQNFGFNNVKDLAIALRDNPSYKIIFNSNKEMSIKDYFKIPIREIYGNSLFGTINKIYKKYNAISSSLNQIYQFKAIVYSKAYTTLVNKWKSHPDNKDKRMPTKAMIAIRNKLLPFFPSIQHYYNNGKDSKPQNNIGIYKAKTNFSVDKVRADVVNSISLGGISNVSYPRLDEISPVESASQVYNTHGLESSVMYKTIDKNTSQGVGFNIVYDAEIASPSDMVKSVGNYNDSFYEVSKSVPMFEFAYQDIKSMGSKILNLKDKDSELYHALAHAYQQTQGEKVDSKYMSEDNQPTWRKQLLDSNTLNEYYELVKKGHTSTFGNNITVVSNSSTIPSASAIKGEKAVGRESNIRKSIQEISDYSKNQNVRKDISSSAPTGSYIDANSSKPYSSGHSVLKDFQYDSLIDDIDSKDNSSKSPEHKDFVGYIKGLFNNSGLKSMGRLKLFLAQDGVDINDRNYGEYSDMEDRIDLRFKSKNGKKPILDQSAVEVFAHEVVHGITKRIISKANLLGQSRNVRALRQLQLEAMKKMTYKDLIPKNLQGDIAYEEEAKQIYNYIFSNDKVTEDVALNEFVAYGLTNPQVMNALKNITIPENKKKKSLFNKVFEIFDKIIKTLLRDKEVSSKDKNGYETLLAIVQEFDKAHQKMLERSALNEPVIEPSLSPLVRKFVEVSDEKLSSVVDKLISSLSVNVQSIKPLSLKSTKKEKTAWILKYLSVMAVDKNYRTGFVKVLEALGLEHQNTLLNVIDTLSEKDTFSRTMEKLVLKTNIPSRQAQSRRAEVYRQLKSSFTNPLSKLDSHSITKALMRTDLSYLYKNTYQGSYDTTMKLLSSDGKFLSSEIARVRDELKYLESDKTTEIYINNLSRVLARLMSEGIGVENMATTAKDILDMVYGSNPYSKQLLDTVDTLTSLYAVQLTDADSKARLSKLEKSGVVKFLELYGNYSQQSVAEEAYKQDVKGYVKSITDDRYSIKLAPVSSRAKMEEMGYTYLGEADEFGGFQTHQNFNADMAYYQHKSGVKRSRQGSAVIVSKANILGQNIDDYFNLNNEPYQNTTGKALQSKAYSTKRRLEKVMRNIDNIAFSTLDSMSNHLVPVVSKTSQDINVFKANMSHANKELYLGMDLDPFDILSQMYSDYKMSVFGKPHNEKVLEVLINDSLNFDSVRNKSINHKKYVQLSRDSDNKYVADSFYAMPENIRKYAEENILYIREDIALALMGTRSSSVVNSQLIQKIATPAVKNIIANTGKHWTTAVQMAKNNIVIRTIPVILQNYMANTVLISAIYLHNPLKVLKIKNRVVTDVVEYMDYAQEALQIELEIEQGKTSRQKKLNSLYSAMKNSPISKLVDRGLFSNIVEDVEASSSSSHYNNVGRMIEEKFPFAVPNFVKEIVSQAYMSESTSSFNFLRTAVEYSDFVARASLYELEYSRLVSEGYSGSELAKMDEKLLNNITDDFINYMGAQSPLLQWFNDVGLLFFTKYFINAQRLVVRYSKDHPMRVILLLALQAHIGDMPDPIDSSIISSGVSGRIQSPIDIMMNIIQPNVLRNV